ncbi:GyrI-like domain-containing protein [Rhodococcus sp. NPDC059234]|uniref:GyrI-like domain-containing protein n=1 Tax=Rhodococcus sp. NPDC059234 TaxID=3346781 RepID=UPI00366A8CAF
MTDPLTDAELTLLGLLSEQPRHGYDLDRVIEDRGMREWTSLGFSSIYYLLDKLARNGLIEPVPSTETRSRRVTYRLTGHGHTSVSAQTLDAIDSLDPIRARVLIGIANSPDLGSPAVTDRLRSRVARLGAQLDELREQRLRQSPLPDQADALFDYAEAMIRADIHWAEQVLARKKGADMDKYDIKKAHKNLYGPTAKAFVTVDVPEMTYIAVDGHGDPNTSVEYTAAVEALYATAYTIKFASKKTHGRDLVVAPLEGLWRAADPSAFVTRAKDGWDWTMMIAQPEWITADDIEQARTAAAAKKDLPALERLRQITLAEGRCVQILHRGPYDDEGPTLARLHDEFMPEHGLTFNGDHHEIYLSDARKTAPERLKTILRQPVRAAISADI